MHEHHEISLDFPGIYCMYDRTTANVVRANMQLGMRHWLTLLSSFSLLEERSGCFFFLMWAAVALRCSGLNWNELCVGAWRRVLSDQLATVHQESRWSPVRPWGGTPDVQHVVDWLFAVCPQATTLSPSYCIFISSLSLVICHLKADTMPREMNVAEEICKLIIHKN